MARYLAQMTGVAMVITFVISTVYAAPGEGGQRGEKGGRRGQGGAAAFGQPGGPTGGGQRPEFQDPDTNGDCLIDDDEAQAVIDKTADRMRENFKRMNEQILNRFDEDGDGALTGAELDKAKEAREQLKQRRRDGGGPAGGPPAGMQEIVKKFDEDGDGRLSDEERQKARAEMMKQRQGGAGGRDEDFRKKMIEKFDADGDGQLNDAERQKAKAEMMKQRRGAGRPGKDIAE